MRCLTKWPKLLSTTKMKAMIFASAVIIVILVICGVTLAKPAVHSAREGEQKTKDLLLVHIVSRHGERTPADTYPNDIYVNNTFYPFGWGQITALGRKSQYASGQFLRKRYDSFLGNLYTPNIVYAQSTGADRAFMSCALILAGLWPPNVSPLSWNSQLDWSPIPIKSEPLSEDTLLLVRKACPRYNEALEDVFELPEVKALIASNANLFKQLTNITGMSVATPDDVQSLYNTLLAEKTFGLALPSWTSKYYPEKLIPLTAKSFELNVYNDLLKRLKGGPLLKKILSDWKTKAAGTLSPSERKLFVYTGHDSTVVNLLHSLGVWETQVPGYGIMTMLELYQDKETKEYGVEIYLRNSTTKDPYLLTIPGCKHHCPLTDLIKLTANVIPANWTQECVANNDSYVPPTPGGP